MGRFGRSARLIETETGYICSRCRAGISSRATACPHCGREIKPPHPPLWRALMALGVILLASGVAVYGVTWVFRPGQHAIYVGSRLGLFGISMGAVALVVAKVWTGFYPVLAWVFHHVKRVLRVVTWPLLAVPRWIGGRIR